MTVSIGDIVLYTPPATHRHMMPAWFLEILDKVDPGARAPVPMPPHCAAIVAGATGPDRYTLGVFVPNQGVVWVDDVEEGDGEHQFHVHATLWRRDAPAPAFAAMPDPGLSAPAPNTPPPAANDAGPAQPDADPAQAT